MSLDSGKEKLLSGKIGYQACILKTEFFLTSALEIVLSIFRSRKFLAKA